MGEKLTAQLKASLKHQEVLEDLEAYKRVFRLYDDAYNKMKDSHRRWMELRRKAGL